MVYTTLYMQSQTMGFLRNIYIKIHMQNQMVRFLAGSCCSLECCQKRRRALEGACMYAAWACHPEQRFSIRVEIQNGGKTRHSVRVWANVRYWVWSYFSAIQMSFVFRLRVLTASKEARWLCAASTLARQTQHSSPERCRSSLFATDSSVSDVQLSRPAKSNDFVSRTVVFPTLNNCVSNYNQVCFQQWTIIFLPVNSRISICEQSCFQLRTVVFPARCNRRGRSSWLTTDARQVKSSRSVTGKLQLPSPAWDWYVFQSDLHHLSKGGMAAVWPWTDQALSTNHSEAELSPDGLYMRNLVGSECVVRTDRILTECMKSPTSIMCVSGISLQFQQCVKKAIVARMRIW